MKTTWILPAIWSTLFSGAAMATAISVPTPSVPPPLIQPLPLKVGLCVTPILRAAHLREVKGEVSLEADESASGQGQVWRFGDAVVDTFTAAMRAAFRDVVLMDDCTPGAALAEEVAAIVIPTLVDAESPSLAWSKGAVGDHMFRHAFVELQMTLQPTEGTAVSWRVSGAASMYSGPWHHNRQELIGRVLSAALLDGCARFIADLSMNPEVNGWLMAESQSIEPPGNGTAIRNRSDIAILSSTSEPISPSSMADCVSSSLSKQDNRISIIPAQQARNALFPWLQESILSVNSQQATVLLSNTLLQERSRQSGLRYLVFITQARGSSNLNGPFFCGGGYGGAGCLGAARIARETSIAAVVWDLELGRESQDLFATERAKDLLVGLVLPLWIPGGLSTKAHACRTMAQKLLQVVHEPDVAPEGSAPDASSVSMWKSTADPSEEVTRAPPSGP